MLLILLHQLLCAWHAAPPAAAGWPPAAFQVCCRPEPELHFCCPNAAALPTYLHPQRGSWNRNNPIGARVMRVVLDPADPLKVRYYVPFLCGGVPGDTCAPGGPVPPSSRGNPYKGRPVDVEQLPDGSLLVSDNEAHTVYRISYAQPTACRVVGTSVPHAALTTRGRQGVQLA